MDTENKLFDIIQTDIKIIHDDVREIRYDVKSLLDFKSKIIVGLTVGTGLLSAGWALFLHFIQ